MNKSLHNRSYPVHPILRLVLFIAIAAGIYFLIFAPIGRWMPNIGLDPYGGGLTGLLAFFIFYSREPVLIIIASYIALRYLENRRLDAIGLRFNKAAVKELFIGISIGLIMTGIIFVIELAFGWIRIAGYAWNLTDTYGFIRSLSKSLILYAAVALTEEIFSRGYVMYELEVYKGRVFAVAVSSVMFGLFHLGNASGSWATYVAPFSLSLFGVLIAYLFYIKRSLWIPIGFHFAWNLFQYEFFSLPGSEGRKSIFFITQQSGPEFWVGLPNSSFGPEVGALGVIAALACIIIVRRYKVT